MISLLRRWKRGAAVVLVGGGLGFGGAHGVVAAEKPPVAEKKPVIDEYHGIKVTDDYQWLEKADDPAVKAWVAGENKVTRDSLDALPDRKAIAARLTELFGKESPRYSSLVSRPAGLFALKFQPPKQQPMLVVMPSANEPDQAKIVLDPNALGNGGKTAIDWFVPSPDGKLVAVSLSENGSEDGTLNFYRTENGERLSDQIPRVQYPTAGGSAAWQGDGAVVYTRFPHPGERPAADANFYQQVYLHKLGADPKGDVYVMGKDFPRIAEVMLESSVDDKFILVAVANGDGGEFAHYLLEPAKFEPQPGVDAGGTEERHPGITPLTLFKDQVKAARFGRDDAIYLQSVQDAPHGKVLRLPTPGEHVPTLADAKVVVPEDAHATIEGMTLTANALFVVDLVGGPSRVRQFPLTGGESTEVPLPPISAVGQVVALEGDAKGVLLSQVSYTTPQAWLSYDPVDFDKTPAAEERLSPNVPASRIGMSPLKPTALSSTSPVDFGDIEAVRDFATSKDGTRVPLNILKKKGTKLDGTNPTLLYGYGGYSISMVPRFEFTHRLWFDRGGVYVVANLRGGGEFGEEWHQGGNLLSKQNVFDDFAAAAEYLIKTGYTRPEKLAVEGGSNGGLLMGAFLTQHPELARAVVSHVGIYDMLRVELDPNGAFNVTEFGSVKDPAQFKALYAYSPYHHVVDGRKYPAVLFMTGDNDGRVNPLHSRKMTARLQAANGSDHPILLRTTANAGHGMGTALNERIAQLADAFAFLFDQLGMKPEPGTDGKD